MIDIKQIVTEEDFIAFIAENIEEFVPDTAETDDTATVVCGDDYVEEYVSEDDIARENGFWIDDDGDWQPLDEDEYDW